MNKRKYTKRKIPRESMKIFKAKARDFDKDKNLSEQLTSIDSDRLKAAEQIDRAAKLMNRITLEGHISLIMTKYN